MITFLDKPQTKETVQGILHPLVNRWFFSKFKDFSLPQLYGVKEVHDRNNIMVVAPTGSGKTLTCFLSILNELIRLADEKKLEERIYAVYISPLKALNNDIARNLQEPLAEMLKLAQEKHKDYPIRVGVRTGDTTTAEKQKMLKQAPHILITTPESLAILLSSDRFRELLRDVTWCVIDEVHALAENKRGVHLSLSLERLQELAPNMTRVGLSATVEPLDAVANYLVGMRDCKVAHVQYNKEFDLQVISPLPDLIDTTHAKLHNAIYATMDKLIQEHKTTLIFTNTRAGTERVVHHLKERFPKNYTENIGAHHGSLSKKHRFDIEQRLKEGKLKAVVCSTSLELGMDIGYVDLVICLGSPKSVARFLQRCLPYTAKILLADGTYREIGDIVENKLDVEILSFDKHKGFIKNRISTYHKNKTDFIITLKTHSGSILECTPEHPLLTRNGWKKTSDLNEGEEIAELFDFNKDTTPYIYEMINQLEFYVENRQDFLRKIVDSLVQQKKLSYSSIAQLIGIQQNHLQNYMRRTGRRKSIRLDIFLKLMNLCKVPRKTFLPYLQELKSKSNHRVPLPLKVDKDFMWLAGIVASDGSITQHKKTKEYKIKIGNTDKNILLKCQSVFNKYGFFPKILNVKRPSQQSFKTLDCGSKLLAQMILSLGLTTKNKSSEIAVSNILYRMPKDLIIPYIEGVLEGDGSVSNDTIRLFSASKKFAQGLHNLLNRGGIYNYFVEMDAKPSILVPKINLKKIFCVHIGRNGAMQNFLKYCTFNGKKVEQLTQNRVHFTQNNNHIEKNICWTKIQAIRKNRYKHHVYNLTLQKEPNNYFVDSILTHNCGRAGHSLHEKVKGRLIPMDRDDLVECAVLLKNAVEKKIDTIHIPENCLDVLAQHIFGMAIADRWNIKDVLTVVKRSYCYRTLSEADFMDVIKYLAGEYATLQDRHIYAKIFYDHESGEIGRRGRMSRVIYMTNIGTIPDQTNILVKVNETVVGTLDEPFLERLQRGDVFVLGGQTYEFLFARGMVAQVKAAAGRQPTVPSWFSEQLPLSYDLAVSIQKFRRLLDDMFVNKYKKEQTLEFIRSYLYVDENAAQALYRYFYEQHLFAGIPHDKRMLVEFYQDDKTNKKYVLFHSLYGRRVNDVLSRAIAYAIYKLQKKKPRDVELGINDNGFFLASDKPIQVLRALEAVQKEDLWAVMKLALEKTEVLKRRFRHCAGRALMILRNYKGQQKKVGKQQVSSMILMSAIKRISDNFSILKEARREVLEDLMDIDHATIILRQMREREIEIKQFHTPLPSPFAFTLITQSYTDILRMEDKVDFIRRMHKNVIAKLGKQYDVQEIMVKEN
ncbi:DEAD/DEAH box helicase [Candidatus Woesearchaeota archaeon]|nr:DEAD/DEAH box helicase [Candidatus Woesearchaeota archaeon]